MFESSFRANTIDEAAKRILIVLKGSINTRENVFYFDGWDGLGASAVLQAVARHITTTSPAGGLEFERVIHIDCSKWESRRALQRVAAEQLDLPAQVMEMFNRQDEEDDFRGVAQGSRLELEEVAREMQQRIQNRRFLVIFHNGSSEEINLTSCCGFPLAGYYSTIKVLWTFQGRFRLKPRMKVDTAMKSAGTTDRFLCPILHSDKKPEEHWSYLVSEEAAELVAACKVNTGPHRIIHQPAQVAECFIYMLELCCRGAQWIDYDWNTQGANYWVCEGIKNQTQQGERNDSAGDDDDELWRSAEALQCEMPLDVDYHKYLPSPHLLTRFVVGKPYWASPTCGFTWIPDRATPNGDMFQHYSEKLSVLKLSGCAINLQSPPFFCCYNLRFLWLDRYQGTGTSTDGVGKERDIGRCFRRLWVLNVSDTDCAHILSAPMLDLMTQLRELNVMRAKAWDMGQLQGRLPNIHKLRVINSRVHCSCSGDELFSEMNKMELLHFSGIGISFLSFSNNSSLETAIVDGIPRISFKGCTELKSLLFSRVWYGGLSTLDISGTAVKTLDLTTTQVRSLRELYLLGCKKLCAILWPPKEEMEGLDLAKLRIDTTQSAPTAQTREEKDKSPHSSAATTGTSAPLHGRPPISEFDWHISMKDARLLVSLEPVHSSSRKAYVDVSSPTIAASGSKDEGIRSHGQVSLQQHPASAVYADITMDHVQQQASSEADDVAPGVTWMWPCPDVPHLPQERCYMHIQDQARRTELLPRGGEQTSGTITVPKFIANCAKILHVHDSLSITSTPSHGYGGSEWSNLEWCKIERCPKLDFVFGDVERRYVASSYQLRTLWASQLLKSRYISTPSPNGFREFPNLTFLHLDLCPRLIYAFPLNMWMHDHKNSFRLLETLEIAWCGDLKEIFPLDNIYPWYATSAKTMPIAREFTKLKHIHLHELPSLQSICGVTMSAPNLETIKIRGCWSLTRLPEISGGNKVVECDCEKDWWNRLEWDDRSRPSHYKPIHSRYYKKTLLRGSVLR